MIQGIRIESGDLITAFHTTLIHIFSPEEP
jgi:hypothetical protein